MTRQELIEQALNNFDDDDLREIWNNYCIEVGNQDEMVFLMEDFNYEMSDLFSHMEPLDIIEKVQDSFYYFDASCDYWNGDEYDLECYNNIHNSPIDIEVLAEYIDYHNQSFSYEEIETILRGNRDDIIEQLNAMSIPNLVDVHNSCAEIVNYHKIYSMDEFNSEIVARNLAPLEIANRIYYGKFSPENSWWWFTGLDNFESTTVRENLPIDVGAIADCIIEHGDMGNPIVEHLLEVVAQ